MHRLDASKSSNQCMLATVLVQGRVNKNLVMQALASNPDTIQLGLAVSIIKIEMP